MDEDDEQFIAPDDVEEDEGLFGSGSDDEALR